MSEASTPLRFDPGCYPHPADRVELIETHVSWVFLAGEYAYKIKKPVRLPFLDFSTLEARRACCEEELRLNRRTAPGIYLGVVTVTGTPENPKIGGDGEAIEYALKMRRFEQDMLGDVLAKRVALSNMHFDALAATIAAFHASIPAITEDFRFGLPDQISEQARENFVELGESLETPAELSRIEHLRAWTLAGSARLADVFAERRNAGFVRECHGDLHLGNIVFEGGHPVLFDCIEFNAGLRWIDVMSDVAFLVMDLLEHGLAAGAWRLLDAYIETTGDYQGLRVLNFYLVYRALVRAKIAMIRARQSESEQAGSKAAEREYGRYIALAGEMAVARRPSLVLMHGVAGSGKSTVAQMLLEFGGAIRVRSDVERKRLHGLTSSARTHAAPHSGIYSPDATRKTYERLKLVVREIVAAGHVAIVDAAFLRSAPRREFYELARELGVPLTILACRASSGELRRRVARREERMNDASEAGVDVLENQVVTEEPLESDELARTEIVNTEMAEAELSSEVRLIAKRLIQVDAAAGLRQ